MTKREQEHYDIARAFGSGRAFTRSEFMNRYPCSIAGPQTVSEFLVDAPRSGRGIKAANDGAAGRQL